MIVENSLKKNDTVTLKLLSGEELVASFQEESDKGYVVDKPVQLVSVPQENGQMGVQFHPYLVTSANTQFTINSSLVVTICPCSEQVSKMYLEQTTSIQLA